MGNLSRNMVIILTKGIIQNFHNFNPSITEPSTLRRPKGIISVRREIKEEKDACKIVKETLSSSKWKDLENDRNIFEII